MSAKNSENSPSGIPHSPSLAPTVRKLFEMTDLIKDELPTGAPEVEPFREEISKIQTTLERFNIPKLEDAIRRDRTKTLEKDNEIAAKEFEELTKNHSTFGTPKLHLGRFLSRS